MPVAIPVATVAAAAIASNASQSAAKKAANAQTQAAQTASDTQLGMFNKVQDNLQPYMDTGNYANDLLKNQLTGLSTPITMDQATLEKTPGYQFNLQQGLKSAQSSAAARGLGVSGAALKGASTYATGLADSTYQQQFQNALTNQGNTYDRLMGVAGLGENAAAGVGNAGIKTGQGIAANTIGAGDAQAASALRGGQAIGNFANSVPNALIASQYQNQGGGNGLFGDFGSSNSSSQLAPGSYGSGFSWGSMG